VPNGHGINNCRPEGWLGHPARPQEVETHAELATGKRRKDPSQRGTAEQRCHNFHKISPSQMETRIVGSNEMTDVAVPGQAWLREFQPVVGGNIE
jgi:hypothetical protein